MEYEGENYTNCDFGMVTKGLLKGLEDLEVGGKHPNNSIIEDGQNIDKSPGDLETSCHLISSEKPLANAHVKNSNEYINNNNNNNMNIRVTLITNVIGALGTVTKKTVTETRGFGNYSIIEIDQNIKKSPGDL